MHAPFDPIDAVTHPNPYPYYADLRNTAPLHWIASRNAWAVVGTPAIAAAFRLDCARVRPPAEPVPAFLRGSRAGAVFGALARMNDGAAHQQQRARVLALMNKLDAAAFGAGAAQVIGPSAATWREERDPAALDALVRRMPVLAVLAALGVAPTRHEPMLAAIQAWVAGLSPLATDLQRAAAIVAMERLLALFAADGIDDVDEAAAHVAVLMQPHEATAGLIAAGLLRLAEHAPLRAAATAGTLAWDAFAAEVLRHDPPVQNTRRTLAADAVVEGRQLHAGDTLLLVLAAAARDPVLHDAPDEFRLDRRARSPLPLGGGAHACPGGAAAAAIAICVWRRVVEWIDGSELAAVAQQVSWQASVNARVPVFGRSTAC